MPKVVDTTTMELAPFALKLPKPFDIKPQFEVELPGKHKALIYRAKVTVYHQGKDGKQQREVPGWRMTIVNRHGLPTAQYGDRDTSYTEPLSVALALKSWAKALTKKKRTNINETDADD